MWHNCSIPLFQTKCSINPQQRIKEGQKESTLDSNPLKESLKVRVQRVFREDLAQWFSPGVGSSYLTTWQSFVKCHTLPVSHPNSDPFGLLGGKEAGI